MDVQRNFLELEPNALHPVWTNEGDIFQVDYTLDSRHTSSYFDTKGNWLETETEISVDELTHEVLQTLNTKMGEYMMIDIERVSTKNGEVLFEVDLKKDDKTYDILFDPNGKILRKKI